MTEEAPPCAPWAAQFLAVLAETGTITRAAASVGISPATAYYYRQRYPAFAGAWQQALRPARAFEPDEEYAAEAYAGTDPGWRTRFLDALAETSNVRLSAARAGVPAATAYRTRRTRPGFAAKWRAALVEGYENLEMELLAYLRSPDGRPKMDVANAIRLMGMHRQSVAIHRADEDDRTEEEVLESLDRKLEAMRQRMLADSAGATDEGE